MSEICSKSKWQPLSRDAMQQIFDSVCPRNSKQEKEFYTPKAQNCSRMRRALSWLEASEKFPEGTDERFVFLWISFNAAYGDESIRYEEKWDSNLERYVPKRIKDWKKFRNFLTKIVEKDQDKILLTVVLENKGDFAVLLKNKYIYRELWDWVRDNQKTPFTKKIDVKTWNQQHDQGGKFRAQNARAMDTMNSRGEKLYSFEEFLFIIFDRLYTLRNQVVHGGATYKSSFNRDSVDVGGKVLGLLTRAILEIMLKAMQKNSEEQWGWIAYPPLGPAPRRSS